MDRNQKFRAVLPDRSVELSVEPATHMKAGERATSLLSLPENIASSRSPPERPLALERPQTKALSQNEPKSIAVRKDSFGSTFSGIWDQPALDTLGPKIPKKVPELPQKPLAYRHSLPALSELAALHRQAGFVPAMSAFDEVDNKPAVHGGVAADPSDPRRRNLHHFEAIISPNANSVRRAQTVRTPRRSRPLDSFGPRSPKDSESFEITIRVAAVAATYVNSIPQNRGKNINGDEIRSILDKNPSLNDLCIALRLMGVTVYEESLAETLTGSVPDVNLSSLAKPASWLRTPTRYRQRRPYSYYEPAAFRDSALSPPRLSKEGGLREAGSRLSYPGLTGTHEWVEKRLSRLMSDEFLRR